MSAICSMTGFGVGAAKADGLAATVEIRAVNHRGLKLAVRHMWRMARFLDSQDKNEVALKVIAWLLSKAPKTTRTTAYHQLQVDILVRLKNPARLDAGLQKIVSFYRR